MKILKNSILLKTTFIVMIITFISKFLGFFREVLVGIQFGVNYLTDAFFLASSIPLIIFSSLLMAITTAFVPVYSSVVSEKGASEGEKYTNRILNISFVFSFLVVIICLLYTPEIVKLIAGGLNEEALEKTINFTRITLPMCLFLSISQVLIGYAQSKQQFILAVAVNIPTNVLLVLVLITGVSLGIEGLVWATLIGSILQIFIQIPFLVKQGFKYKITFGLNDYYIKHTLKLVIPVFIGTSVQQINFLVDRMLASQLEEGSISALNFATKLNGFVFGIVATSVATIIYPLLTDFKSKSDTQSISRTTGNALNSITIITFPIVVITMLFNKEIVQLLFQYGAFNNKATQMTSGALFYFAFGMLFLGYREVLNRVFYSFHDTKTPMNNSVIAILVNIVLSVILARHLGLEGIALASSIAAMVTTILLGYNMSKKFNINIGLNFFITLFKTFIASLIMGIFSVLIYLIFKNIAESNLQLLLLLLISVSVGFLGYIISGYLLNIQELRSGLDSLSVKSKKFMRKK